MKRVLLTASLCIAIVLGCVACGKEQVKTAQSMDTAMGTIVSQSLYVSHNMEQSSINAVTSDLYQILKDLEQQVLSWRLDTSEVAKINASAGDETGIILSEELLEILGTCNQVSMDSDGAFDITIGEVVRLWDIDSWATYHHSQKQSGEKYVLPESEEIEVALAKTGYEQIMFSEHTLTMPEDMQIDLGAVGKGIALDYIHAYLQEQSEVVGAVISVGGSVLTYGSKSESEINSNPWKVAIVDPIDTDTNLGYLLLEGQWCVSTSGDYERYVVVNDKRYHHIIDPSTGMPADSGIRSVTILTKNGLLSDALSTACFVLGIEDGMMLAEKYEAEVLFVDENGEIAMSEGMEQYFYLNEKE